MIKTEIKYNNELVTNITSENDEVNLLSSGKFCDSNFDIKFDCPIYDESVSTSISVTSPPAKTTYVEGLTLNLTGIAVSDNNGNNITEDCTFSPADGSILSLEQNIITISYYTFTCTLAISVSAKAVDHLQIETAPTKVSYKEGETLDLSGIKVNAIYNNLSIEDVTSTATYYPANGAMLTSSDTNINISFGGKSINQAISITALSSIAVTTAPTKTTYDEGENLDLTGIVITATYIDLTTNIVTNSCTYNPANGAALTETDTKVTITYASKTCELELTIIADPLSGFTYTGTYNENYVYNSNNDTCLALLTSGTLTLKKDAKLDIFLVGGGAGGSASALAWSGGKGTKITDVSGYAGGSTSIDSNASLTAAGGTSNIGKGENGTNHAFNEETGNLFSANGGNADYYNDFETAYYIYNNGGTPGGGKAGNYDTSATQAVATANTGAGGGASAGGISGYGGGTTANGGGGSAATTQTSFTLTAGNHTITIGAGGSCARAYASSNFSNKTNYGQLGGSGIVLLRKAK